MSRRQGRPRAAPGAVRVIGGRWRGRRLPVADADALRPTPDRLRETLFNWLAPVLPGARCLDLFAGSGALGLEALSRGAAEVVLVESQPATARLGSYAGSPSPTWPPRRPPSTSSSSTRPMPADCWTVRWRPSRPAACSPPAGWCSRSSRPTPPRPRYPRAGACTGRAVPGARSAGCCAPRMREAVVRLPAPGPFASPEAPAPVPAPGQRPSHAGYGAMAPVVRMRSFVQG